MNFHEGLFFLLKENEEEVYKGLQAEVGGTVSLMFSRRQ